MALILLVDGAHEGRIGGFEAVGVGENWACCLIMVIWRVVAPCRTSIGWASWYMLSDPESETVASLSSVANRFIVAVERERFGCPLDVDADLLALRISEFHIMALEPVGLFAC